MNPFYTLLLSAVIVLFCGCRKDTAIDLRDKLTGTYTKYGITHYNIETGEKEGSVCYDTLFTVAKSLEDDKSLLIHC